MLMVLDNAKTTDTYSRVTMIVTDIDGDIEVAHRISYDVLEREGFDGDDYFKNIYILEEGKWRNVTNSIIEEDLRLFGKWYQVSP